jgi:hypothetical protein
MEAAANPVNVAAPNLALFIRLIRKKQAKSNACYVLFFQYKNSFRSVGPHCPPSPARGLLTVHQSMDLSNSDRSSSGSDSENEAPAPAPAPVARRKIKKKSRTKLEAERAARREKDATESKERSPEVLWRGWTQWMEGLLDSYSRLENSGDRIVVALLTGKESSEYKWSLKCFRCLFYTRYRRQRFRRYSKCENYDPGALYFADPCSLFGLLDLA